MRARCLLALGYFIFSCNHYIELQKTQRLAWRWDKKGGGEEAGREERTSPSLRSRFSPWHPLYWSLPLLYSNLPLFSELQMIACVPTPPALRREGRGGEGRGASVHRLKVGDRHFRSPQEYACAEGYHKRPFSSWNGSRRKYWPKGKYQGKKTGWYITHLYDSQKIDLFFCPILRKWYICNKGRQRLFF